jgi:hypothetical protein
MEKEEKKTNVCIPLDLAFFCIYALKNNKKN